MMRKLVQSVSVVLLILAVVLSAPGAATSAPLSWSKSAGGGFGIPTNFAVDSMAVFNNRLYAGVKNPFDGCQVWSRAEAGGWKRVDTGGGGFGNYDNLRVSSMAVFNNRLYAGTYNSDPETQQGTGCEVWSFSGSGNWTRVDTGGGGFGEGDDNFCAGSMAVFNNRLYVGTYNDSGEGCQVWGWSGSGNWTRADKGELGSGNWGACVMKAFNNRLYVGTGNLAGCEVWEYSGSGPWKKLNIGGSGFGDSWNISATSIEVYRDRLYVGTDNDGPQVSTGCQVWEWSGAGPWYRVDTGGGGFGNSANFEASSMAVVNDWLFVGTWNRNLPSFDSTGCEVWGYNGAGTWERADAVEGDGGFGNTENQKAPSMTPFKGRLFVGTLLVGGCEVWASDPPPPPPPLTWYLAEGTNAWGFSTYITLENPNDRAVTATLTYMNTGQQAGGGAVFTRDVTLPPLSQTTVSSMDDIGEVDFSTKVTCLEGKTIAVDRTMFWTGTGFSPEQSGYHSSIGTISPSRGWYLPEGSSAWDFETWTLVLNPNSREADVTLTYMTGGGPVEVKKTVPANSRASYNMEQDLGAETDASVEVTSSLPVVAERSMYRDGRREGSCSIGATNPDNDFFLSEGATGWDVGFTTYVLVQNPSDTDNDVTITYQTQSGEVEGPSFTMKPNTRHTVRVNDSLPPNTNVSTHVHGSRPLIAERAMYFDNGTGEAFHASIGLDSPHMSFYLPDGQTAGGVQTWTLVQNPNPGAVTVRITYLLQGGGTPVTFTDEIPPGTRATYNMAEKLGDGARASILVESLDGARPVMAERAMYWSNQGGGTGSIGGFSD